MLPVILRDSDFPYNSMNEVWVGNIFNDPCIRPVEHHLNMSALENWWLYIMMRGSSSFNFNMQGVWGCKQCVFCLIRFFQVSLEVVATIKKMVVPFGWWWIPTQIMVKLGNQPMKQWWPVGLPGVSCISCSFTFRASEKENQSTKLHICIPQKILSFDGDASWILLHTTRTYSLEVWQQVRPCKIKSGPKKKAIIQATLGGGNSNIFHFHLYLGNWSNLTNIFEMGWNHQLEHFSEAMSNLRGCRWIGIGVFFFFKGNLQFLCPFFDGIWPQLKWGDFCSWVFLVGIKNLLKPLCLMYSYEVGPY